MPFSFCLIDTHVYQVSNHYYIYNSRFRHIHMTLKYHLNNPDKNINDAILLININALSCQSIPTYNHPKTPIKCNNKFQGSELPTDVKDIAINNKILAVHLIYHDKSCCGVIFTFSYLSFVNLVYQIYNQN